MKLFEILPARKKGVDYVSTYLGSWAHPRNEIVRFGGVRLDRERERLRRTRDRLLACYK